MEKKKPSKLKRFLPGLGVVLLFIIGAFMLANIMTVDWGFENVDNLTWEKIDFLFHSEGTGGNYEMVTRFILQVALPVVGVTVAAAIAFRLCRRWRAIRMFALVAVVLLLTGFSQQQSIYAWNYLGIGEYMENKNTYSSFVDDNYMDPTFLNLEFPEEKRNLIYIFLESMECTYADQESGGGFETNCIPELTQISQENENFSGEDGALNGGHSLSGATWTVGAMFAQFCGLPLMINIDDNAMSTQDSFLPGVTGLGDILEDEGYKQVLMVGSDATYGGRRLLFENHGDFEILDYNTYTSNGTLPEDYRVWWGFEDAKLFEYAKEEITELADGDEPFNFTMLTVDTHFEDGYLCEDCPSDYDTQYANVMACSSKRVAEFLDWIQQQDFYENTTVVICGDHLTMDSDFCKDVDDDYDRRTYVAYINSAAERDTSEEEDIENSENVENTGDEEAEVVSLGTSARDYSTMDLFPTTLAALGVEIPGNRLALGTNLFSNEETLLEKYSLTEVNKGLQEQSALFDSLTEDIKEITADVTYKKLTDSSDALDFTVTDISSDKINGVQAVAHSDVEDSKRQWYKCTDEGDGTYSIHIPLIDFPGAKEISLQIYTQVDGQTGPAVYSETIELPTVDVSATDATISVNAYDYTVGYFSVDVSMDPSVASQIVDMQANVWPAEDETNIECYTLENYGEGNFELRVYAADFGFLETTYEVELMATLSSGRQIEIGQTEGEIT